MRKSRESQVQGPKSLAEYRELVEAQPMSALTALGAEVGFRIRPSVECIVLVNEALTGIVRNVFAQAGHGFIHPDLPNGFAKALAWTIKVDGCRARAAVVAAILAPHLYEEAFNQVFAAAEKSLASENPSHMFALSTFRVLKALPNQWEDQDSLVFPQSYENYIELELRNLTRSNPNAAAQLIPQAAMSILCWRWWLNKCAWGDDFKPLIEHFKTFRDASLLKALLEGAETALGHEKPRHSALTQYGSDLARFNEQLSRFRLALTQGYEHLGLTDKARASRLEAAEAFWTTYDAWGETRPDEGYSPSELQIEDSVYEAYWAAIKTLEPLMSFPLNLTWCSWEWRPDFSTGTLHDLCCFLVPELSANARKDLISCTNYDLGTIRKLQEHNRDLLPQLYQTIGNDSALLLVFLGSLLFQGEVDPPPNEEFLASVLPLLTNEQRGCILKSLAEADERARRSARWHPEPSPGAESRSAIYQRVRHLLDKMG